MKYGLIGEKLGHSYSKEIHSVFADYKYELCEVSKDDLANFFKERRFNGINVTIPYKKDVIGLLDFVSPEALEIGAVNTVVNRDGKLYGYNTDYFGLIELLKKNSIDVLNKKVLILGTGGTSNTAYAVLKKLGASEIIKVSRTGVKGCPTYEQAIEIHSDADIIINTTPCGMYPNSYDCPIDITAFQSLYAIADIIYNPLKTVLVKNGEAKGIKSVGGLYMLAAQAVYASALFRSLNANSTDIEKAYDYVLKSKRNIVLVGMPGCGKTTIGKRLAKALGREFADTDDAVTEKIKMPISEFFAKNGEKAFREIESNVIKDIAKESGLVIATGGGAVLIKDNVDALKMNGVTVFLDRPLHRLAVTSSRPLSSSKDAVKKLYNERYRIYKECADITVPAESTPHRITETVLSEVAK